MALLIAIEGIDGSGKGTQAALLSDRLKREGKRVELISFPRYQQTCFGSAIGDFLNGRFGSLETVHPQLAALLFAGDRFESRQLILRAAVESEIVIFDRYVASNIAHQAAKLDDPARSDLMRWIETIEYEVYALPRPDLNVLLDVPVTAAQRLIRAKSSRSYTDKVVDLQEANSEYLERVRQVYCDLARTSPTWTVIECTESGDVQTRDAISRRVQSAVQSVVERVSR